MEKILPVLEKGESTRSLSFIEEEAKLLKGFQLLTIKPVLYVANVGEGGFENNNILFITKDLRSWKFEVVAICVEIEAQRLKLDIQENKNIYQRWVKWIWVRQTY